MVNASTSAMTPSFFAASYSASRADALIQKMQIGVASAPPAANTGFILADEACGQALIDKVAEWLAAELGGPVLAIPVLGSEGNEAKIQVLIGNVEATSFGPLNDWSFDALAEAMRTEHKVGTRLVVMDPRTPFFAQRANWIHEAGEAFLVGAMGAPSGSYRGPIGMSFGLSAPVISRTLPGVERLSGDFAITAAEGQVVHEIDSRPALDVLREVAGDILARKIEQIPSFLYTAFPVSSAEPQDFLVRRINGLGQRSGSFSIEDEVLPGMPISFARRNGAHVANTLKLGVRELLARAGSTPRAAIFLSDQRREPDFDIPEAGLVAKELGEIPLIHGTINSVISNNRLYALASQLILIL